MSINRRGSEISLKVVLEKFDIFFRKLNNHMEFLIYAFWKWNTFTYDLLFLLKYSKIKLIIFSFQ